MFRSTLPSPAGEDDQYILSSNADFVFIFRNVYVHEYYTEINCFVTCVQKRSSFLPVAIKFRLVKLQSRNASASIMNFFPSCCWQANIILLVTSFTSPSDYVLFSPSHVCRQLAILVADFFSSHVLYFARAESSISTKWSANCKETKGLWGSSKRFFRDAGFCLIQRTGFGIRNSKFEIKTRVRIGTESIHGMRNAENNHRDYEIARNLVRDYETEEPDWEPPNLTQSSKNSGGLGKNDHSR